MNLAEIPPFLRLNITYRACWCLLLPRARLSYIHSPRTHQTPLPLHSLHRNHITPLITCPQLIACAKSSPNTSCVCCLSISNSKFQMHFHLPSFAFPRLILRSVCFYRNRSLSHIVYSSPKFVHVPFVLMPMVVFKIFPWFHRHRHDSNIDWLRASLPRIPSPKKCADRPKMASLVG